jgi:hypothetical protein
MKTKFFIQFILILSIISSANSQIALNGYLESELSTQIMADEGINLGHYKMRFDMEADALENVRIFFNAENQSYFGQTFFDLSKFYPGTLDSLNRAMLTMMPYFMRDSLSIMNMYGIYNTKKIELTLGRQPLAFGTGYAWNPVDVFNHKDFLDPSSELRGVDAVRLRWQILNRLSLDGVYRLGSIPDNSDAFLEMKWGIGSLDISVLASNNLIHSLRYQAVSSSLFDPSMFEFPVLDSSIFNNLFPIFYYPKINFQLVERKQYGLTFSTELMGMGIHGEYGHNTELNRIDDTKRTYQQWLLGLDYTFNNGLYFMYEWMKNENGLSSIDDLDIQRYLQYMSGEHLSLFRNYSFINLSYGLKIPVVLNTFAIFNHDDISFTITPSAQWTLNDYLVFNGFVGFNGGDAKSEFGLFKAYSRFQITGYF